jgi:uncharacterized protein YfaS (alpha-2-macroglobulin family)
VTVEGDRALWVRRLSVGADGTTIDIPIDKEWLRHDLYVSVMVLRPGNSGEKVTPARALGLLHMPLDRNATASSRWRLKRRRRWNPSSR